jgi:hypothetical protein
MSIVNLLLRSGEVAQCVLKYAVFFLCVCVWRVFKNLTSRGNNKAKTLWTFPYFLFYSSVFFLNTEISVRKRYYRSFLCGCQKLQLHFIHVRYDLLNDAASGLDCTASYYRMVSE